MIKFILIKNNGIKASPECLCCLQKYLTSNYFSIYVILQISFSIEAFSGLRAEFQ